MSKIVRIENLGKQSFNLMIDFDPGNAWGCTLEKGKWRTLSQGVIAYNMGYTEQGESKGTLTTYHLYLCHKEVGGWIIRLNDYGDFWGQNSNGDGVISETAEAAFKSGYIKWEVVRIPDVS